MFLNKTWRVNFSLHFIITFPIVWWRESALQEVAKVPTSTRTHLTIIPRTCLVSMRFNSACDRHSLIERMVPTIFYYRLRTSEVFPDNDGSGKDTTAGCANTQYVQASFWWLIEISQLSKRRGSVCQAFLSFHGKPSRKVNSCGIAHRCLY